MAKRKANKRFPNLGNLEALKKSCEAKSTTTRKKKGRKKFKRTKREASLHFRASFDEKEMIEEEAERLGTTVSTYIRLTLREKLGLTQSTRQV